MSSSVVVHLDGEIYTQQRYGGIKRVFDNLITALAQSARASVLIHLKPGTDWQINGLGIRNRSIRKPMQLRPRRYFRRLNQVLHEHTISRHWGRIRNGVFHSTYYTTFSSLRVPQVLTLHDMTFEDHPECFQNRQRWSRHVEAKKLCVEGADAIICPSLHSKQRLLEYYGTKLGAKEIHVIPWGLDPSLPEACRALDKDQPRLNFANSPFLLHVGARHPHKNTRRLLRMFGQSRLRREFQLVCVGGGEWSAEEQRLIDELKLDGRIRNVPRATTEQLAAFYATAATVVVPSLDEGFGFPVLEAMAFGKPVAASRAGALPEVGGDVPFYFDPTSLEEMEQSVNIAVARNSERNYMLSAQKRAEAFRWDVCAYHHLEIYACLGVGHPFLCTRL